MLLEEVLRLFAELKELGAAGGAARARELDVGAFSDVVDEVRVDDVLLGPLNQMNELPQSLAYLFEHRVTDVDPPLIGLHVLDQRELLCDDWDRLLIFERTGDLHH